MSCVEEDSSSNRGSDESLNIQSSSVKDPKQTTSLFDVNKCRKVNKIFLRRRLFMCLCIILVLSSNMNKTTRNKMRQNLIVVMKKS